MHTLLMQRHLAIERDFKCRVMFFEGAAVEHYIASRDVPMKAALIKRVWANS
jgi:hypothetical protein